jgi:cytoskeleton protein RodZ
MSERDSASGVFTLGQEPFATLSGGALLRQAREARGLQLGTLSLSLKVSVKKLEAIEADRFDLLPDIVFARALVSSMCRHLKIDSSPILALLPPTASPSLKSDESGINTPFHAASYVSIWAHLNKRTFWGVIALLVVSGLIFALSSKTLNMSGVHAPTSGLTQIPPPLQKLTVAASDVTPSLQAVSAPNFFNASASIVPGSGATTGAVVFSSHGLAWIEVIDAKGVVQVRKTLANGEVVGASGPAPLSVVVGKVDSVEVSVFGRPFDLTHVAKDNVARFEVKP